ncbi:MAG: alpha-(1-_3)-arabinofuranosyltransferase family protein [Candidatus Thermoplasmatota archaeon]
MFHINNSAGGSARYGRFVLLLAVGIVLYLIFLQTKGEFVIDSYINPLISPAHAFKNLLYSWDSTLLLGQSYTWSQTYLFPYSFFYYLLSFFFNVSMCQTVIFVLILWIGFYSFTKFIQTEFSTTSMYTYIGGLFYIFNLYTLINLAGASSLLLPYVILPLQLYLMHKIVLSERFFRYGVGFSLATLFMGGINPPLVAINMIVIFAYGIHLLFLHNLRKKLRPVLLRVLFCLALTVLVNAYWIVGILSFFQNSADMSTILSEPLSMQNQASSYLNVFRTLGLWAFGQGWDGVSYYGYSAAYLGKPLLMVSMYLLPLIALSSVVFIRKSKQIFWVLILIITSIPMVVATNQGIFSTAYAWAYDHVPLFSMFRGSYKFIQVYIFGLSILSAYLLVSIRNVKLKNALAAVLTILVLINAFPFFTKQLFQKDSIIQGIPSYYYDAEKYFRNDSSSFRIFLLPAQYFAVYDWGKISANPEILFNKGLVMRQAGSSEEESNKIALDAYAYLFNKDYGNFEYLMRTLNVKYILQRNDFDWAYYKEISQSPEVVADVLSKYEKVATFGKLDLYQINTDYLPLINSNNVTFEKVNSVKYKIYLKNIHSAQALSFLESYDTNWNLYLKQNPTGEWCRKQKEYKVKDDAYYALNDKINELNRVKKPDAAGRARLRELEFQKNNLSESTVTECVPRQKFMEGDEISFIYKKSVFDTTHTKVYGYANQWTIDADSIKKNFDKSNYTENADGSINVELTLYFKPQTYFDLGLIVSGVTLLGCFGYFIYGVNVNRKKRRNGTLPVSSSNE